MRTILVVDDEVTVAEMLRATLEDEGYRVVTAADGKEALERLPELCPDLVLSDVMMPLLDGRQLANAMAEDPTLQQIPLVLMSAGGEWIVKDRCRYTAFVAKPFELDALLHQIEQVLQAPAH